MRAQDSRAIMWNLRRCETDKRRNARKGQTNEIAATDERQISGQGIETERSILGRRNKVKGFITKRRIGKMGYIMEDSDKRWRSSILDRDRHT